MYTLTIILSEVRMHKVITPYNLSFTIDLYKIK